MEDLTEFITRGINCKERLIAVNEQVNLQVITFKPVNDTINPAIIFVSGWISRISGWKDVLIEMSRDFPVYYIETREKNSSVIYGEVSFRVEDFARDIAAVVDALNLSDGKFILCGSSLGATSIVESCRFLKRKPLCLVLIGVNAVFYAPIIWKIMIYLFPPRFYLIMKPVIKWYLRNFRLDVHNDWTQYVKYCGNLDAANPWSLKKAALEFIRYEIWSKLPDIQIPTLLVSASKDELHDHENIQKISSMLPNSKTIDMEINSNSHSPVVVGEIRKYIGELMNYLDACIEVSYRECS
ncbi:alpha/beta hydrolase [bacterium]|nr:alpha/beta hydrolase [bacterium]MBU1064707.1 alpha/beta hydrolase [bacterium]MBU1635229.1 alpha/beta hydrolase [bacterium]MBU1875471.1 alpha/beta hydrolase [bacterium]